MRFLRAALPLMLAVSSTAGAYPPSALPEKTLRADLAAALHIDIDHVVDAAGVGITRAKGTEGIVVGRYREKQNRWTFPALATYHPCKLGTCVASVHLGSAARRVAAVELIDLDAPSTTLQSLEFRSPGSPLPEPPKRAKWPVLVVVAERQVEGREETDLLLVSLRPASQPTVLFDRTIHERWTQPSHTDPPPPAHAPIGRATERVVVGREGKSYRLTMTERPIDSPTNPCLRSKAFDYPFLLDNGRFRESPLPPGVFPPIPCH